MSEMDPRPRHPSQRRNELLLLARWIEEHFKLGATPKIANASEAEVIYAQVLYRIAGLSQEVGSHGNQPVSEASGPAQSEAQK